MRHHTGSTRYSVLLAPLTPSVTPRRPGTITRSSSLLPPQIPTDRKSKLPELISESEISRYGLSPEPRRCPYDGPERHSACLPRGHFPAFTTRPASVGSKLLEADLLQTGKPQLRA